MKKLARNIEFQRRCLLYFRRVYPKLHQKLVAIPNIGNRNALSREQQMIGMSKGTANLFLAVPRNGLSGAWFLLKPEKRRPATTAQNNFRNVMIESGYAFFKVINFEDFQDELRGYLEEQINEHHVEQVVCRYLQVDPSLLHTKTSKQEIVRARQITCYAAQILTGKRDCSVSYQFFKDHCGGIHGRSVIKSLYASDTQWRAKIDDILNELMISPKYMQI